MNKAITMYAPSHSCEAAEQRLQRHIVPILESILDANAPKIVQINSDGDVCINGTPIGDYRYMSEFRKEDEGFALVFTYSETERHVYFGTPLLGAVDKVEMIHDITATGVRTVYER